MHCNRWPILFFLLMASVCWAQEAGFVRGKVLDGETKEPVVFATVRILGKAKGVITNMDGSFRLPLEFRKAGESISISSMGYSKKEYELQQLSPEHTNIIYLDPGVLGLSEAVVTADKPKNLSARKIVRTAIKNIPTNYPSLNFSTKGYYRDYQKDSLGYLNFNEAFLEIFDHGFDEIDTATTKTRIYDYIQNLSFRRDTLADDPYNYKDYNKTIRNAYLSSYKGNELQILRVHDPFRNYRLNSFDFINNLGEGDILKNHRFKKLEDSYLDGEPLYTIEIKKSLPGYSVKGIVYIAKKDFAFHKMVYTVYDDSRRNKNDLLRAEGIKGTPLYEVTVEYKRGLAKKMYPNYISLHNTFRLAQPPKFILEYVTVLAEEDAFLLHFNKLPAQDEKQLNANFYDFKFKGEKVQFKKVEILNDGSIKLIISPNKNNLNMMGELWTMGNKGLDTSEVLEFKVEKLRDIDGNIINEWTYKEFDQYREFFVQEVSHVPAIPTSVQYMDKRKPIFSGQPISKPDNFSDYWMNTPLPNIKNYETSKIQ